MTTEPREQHEPSMEEILSSIRRIIADEEAEEAQSEDELGAAEAQAEALNEDADALAEAAEDEEAEDVLELTKVVRESGEVVDLKAESAVADEPPESVPHEVAAEAEAEEIELAPIEETPSEAPAEMPPAAVIEDEATGKDQAVVETKTIAGEELVSATAASAATGAFAKLSQVLQRTPAEESVADDSGRTVEQFIEDILRPMLKEWLDDNMPPLVERLVQSEIQKIARRAELM